MGKKISIIIFILMVAGGVIFAGDIARFVNLGFSSDGKYFMFGQYGVREEGNKPYADIFLVRVSKNNFVENGVKHLVAKKSAFAGDTGEGALFSLLEETVGLKKKYRIDHFERGRLLYILLNGEKPKEKVTFRDFEGGRLYTIHLIQDTIGKGENVRSSFYLDVNIKSLKTEDSKHYQVGLPEYRRKGVKSYKLRQIVLSPGEKSLIFVIEKEEVDRKGSNIRYMVEALSLN